MTSKTPRELSQAINDTHFCIESDPDSQETLQNYVMYSKGETLASSRGNLAYKSKKGTYDDWWSVLAPANDLIQSYYKSGSPQSCKLNLDLLCDKLRFLGVAAGLVTVYGARTDKDKSMVCHALNESKLFSLGEGFENISISALPMFRVASPVAQSCARNEKDMNSYHQLVLFEGLSETQSITEVMNAFFAVCNTFQPKTCVYMTNGKKSRIPLTIAGLKYQIDGPGMKLDKLLRSSYCKLYSTLLYTHTHIIAWV